MNNATSFLRKASTLATKLTSRTIQQYHGASKTVAVTIPVCMKQVNNPLQYRHFASSDDSKESMHVEVSKVQGSSTVPQVHKLPEENMTGIGKDSTADVEDDEDEMEQEEMFVSPDSSLGTDKVEWGGPRRGGRMPEPTRFGDWERKGRCTDF